MILKERCRMLFCTLSMNEREVCRVEGDEKKRRKSRRNWKDEIDAGISLPERR